MASLFNKFQEAVKVLAKSPTFSRDPRKLQFETDINRLFLYTSYNRLGREAEVADAEEIIEMASKASLADQEKQVQENIHDQIKGFCCSMDEILLPNDLKKKELSETVLQDKSSATHRSGLSLAVGANSSHSLNRPVVPQTKPLRSQEVSQKIKDRIGYTLDVKRSQIPHKDAGQGLFLDGEANVGAVVAFYPGVIYSPAYYRYIPGYPRVDVQNSYLITRYDGTVINAQPWGSGGESRNIWDGYISPEIKHESDGTLKGSDRIWRMLSRPIDGSEAMKASEVLELRNPLALGHFANHPSKGMSPNVMICPYDFPSTEREMRPYVPNIAFGNPEVSMKRFGSFWFRTGGSRKIGSDGPALKALVLVATRALCNEELLLNYRLSNSKRRPSWYYPVDEEEDRRRWS